MAGVSILAGSRGDLVLERYADQVSGAREPELVLHTGAIIGHGLVAECPSEKKLNLLNLL